jgi:DNA-binding FadR family transcriptional regulator
MTANPPRAADEREARQLLDSIWALVAAKVLTQSEGTGLRERVYEMEAAARREMVREWDRRKDAESATNQLISV